MGCSELQETDPGPIIEQLHCTQHGILLLLKAASTSCISATYAYLNSSRWLCKHIHVCERSRICCDLLLSLQKQVHVTTAHNGFWRLGRGL